jgi:uncharacterized protein YaaQ
MMKANSMIGVLIDLARELSDSGNFAKALNTVELMDREDSQVDALTVVAKEMTARNQPNRAFEVIGKALGIVDEIDDDLIRFEAKGKAIAALTEMGKRDDARSHFQSALVQAHLVGRKAVLSVLESAAPTIAAADQGETLFRVFVTISEINRWWDLPKQVNVSP